MVYKVINEIANVPNKEILIPTDAITEVSMNINFT